MIKDKKPSLEKKPSLLLTIGAASLLIGGGVAAYWVLTQRYGLPGDVPVGANIIPQDALLTLSVSTDSGQWQKLRSFGTQQTQAELDKNLVQLRDRFLTSNGYNYQQDIQPWVGKQVTIAFLSPQPGPPTNNPTQNPTSLKQESVVVVLPIDNPVRAKQVLEKPKPLEQGKWIDRTYKGVQIKETSGGSQNYSATVLDGRFLVVSDSPKATEQAIDTYKGGTSITATDGYIQALRKIESPQFFAQLYINVPAAAKIAAAIPGKSVPSQGLAQLQENQGLATTITLEPQGMRFNSISWLKPKSNRVYAVENKAGKMQSRVPAETLMMLSGGNLQRLWQDEIKGAKSSNPLAPIPPEELRQGVKSITGLDLDEDLLKWMDGEFSLSVVPAVKKEGSPDNFALSLVFMVQASDKKRALQSLQQLDEVMNRKYQFEVKEALVGGQSVINWIAPYGTVTASHGWLDGNVAFFSLGAPITSAIVPNPATTLASTDVFQKTVPSELQPNNGQFFLDVDRATKIFPLPQLSPSQQMLVDAMHSIGVTTAVSDERSIRYDIFVSLKKAGKPSPLPSPSIESSPSSPTPSATPSASPTSP